MDLLKDVPRLVQEAERHIGVTFGDKSLLQRALTHRSFLNETPNVTWEDNERLEFLGDAVLGLVVAEYLYHRFPEMPEGILTAVRSNLVRRRTLASFARRIHLGRYLLLGAGEERSGGRERDAVLCAAFEALIGAIYLDQGLDAARAFILDFVEDSLDAALQGALEKDAKSRLQEWSQATLHLTPRYVTVAETGPDHAKRFHVEVRIGPVVAGRGEGFSKQEATQAAAENALQRLDAILDEFQRLAEDSEEVKVDEAEASGTVTERS